MSHGYYLALGSEAAEAAKGGPMGFDLVYVHNQLPGGGGKLTEDWLNKYYGDIAQAADLIDLGAMSEVKQNIKPSRGGHAYNTPEPDVTVAYHRDRGERMQKPKHFKTLDAMLEFTGRSPIWVYNVSEGDSPGPDQGWVYGGFQNPDAAGNWGVSRNPVRR